jgi:hypothetical protein
MFLGVSQAKLGTGADYKPVIADPRILIWSYSDFLIFPKLRVAKTSRAEWSDECF